MQLSKKCTEYLENAEKRITVLINKNVKFEETWKVKAFEGWGLKEYNEKYIL